MYVSPWLKARKKHLDSEIENLKHMSDEQVVEILNTYGKQFCPLLQFAVTDTKGRYRLTDEMWSWSLYLTLDDMQIKESENTAEWIKITFTRFNDYLVSIRKGMESK